jgi:hypothetical protein
MTVLLFTVVGRARVGLARLVLIQRILIQSRIDRRVLGWAVAVSFMGEACYPKPLSELQNQAPDGDQSVDTQVVCGE